MKAINTGPEPVTLSAMEQHVEKELRIFDDPFAEKMLPTSMKFFVDLCRFPGFRNWIEASSEKAIPVGMQVFCAVRSTLTRNCCLCVTGYRQLLRSVRATIPVLFAYPLCVIQEVFDSLENTPAGSYLAFTYVDKDFLDGKDRMRWDAAFKKYVKPGIWRFGLTKQSSGASLDAHGWDLLEDVSTEETIRSELLNRRGLHSSAVERFVFAQKR